MALHVVLAVAALAASAALFFSSHSRVLAVVALIASGIEVAMALGMIHLSIAGLPLRLILGLALAVPGVLLWLRSSGKGAVSASALVAFVGALQVLTSVGRL